MDVTIKCTYWFYHHRFLSKLQAVAAKIASGRSKIYKRSQQKLQAVASARQPASLPNVPENRFG